MKYKGLVNIFLVVILIFVVAYNRSNVQETLSRYGSVGDEVRQIQTKLKQWGYNVGTVDGIYKWRTQNAVKEFQKNNGLTADGIAGPKTLEKMGIYSNKSTSSYESNVRLLARLINSEARGEPYTGQVAVGAVVLNRVKHPSFPNTIAAVIYQPGAFTALQDGQWNAAMEETSYRAARDAMSGWDPSKGAIYYYNPAKTTNRWMLSRPVVITIGTHIFCK